MARTFDGSDDFISLSLGAAGSLSAAVTVAAIVRRTDDTTVDTIVQLGADGGQFWRMQITAADILRVDNSVNNRNSTFTVVAADGWCLVAFRKAAGTSAIRPSVYKYGTNAWTHETQGTLANNTPATSSTIGATGAAATPFAGDIAIVGAWASDMTNAQLESLAYTLNAWFQVQPNGLWILDQAATSMPVWDLTGNGANQTAITGTAVATSAVPGFSYGAPVIVERVVGATTHSASLTIAGNGAFAFTGTRQAFSSLTVAGAGALAFTGTRSVAASLTILGNGTLAFTGSRAAQAQLAIAGAGDLAFTANRTALATLAILGNGTLAFTGFTPTGDPLRRRFRNDTDARDTLATRPTGPRGRHTEWWN